MHVPFFLWQCFGQKWPSLPSLPFSEPQGFESHEALDSLDNLAVLICASQMVLGNY